MLLWQAIALAGGLSLIGAPLIFGLSPFGDSPLDATITAVSLVTTEDLSALDEHNVHPVHLFALCLAVLLAGHLLLTLARTYLRVLSARRRHRQLVHLLSTPPESGADVRQLGPLTEAHIIEHDAPLAYCLPGRTHASSVTVLSRGLLEQLTREELAAVVAHERTHLQQRHHLLTMAFEAWYRALPWLPTTRYGREAVLELTEMLADDGALREHTRDDLLRSLALSTPESSTESASQSAPAETLAATPGATGVLITTARLQRLLVPRPGLSRSSLAGVVLLALGLLAVPTGLILLS